MTRVRASQIFTHSKEDVVAAKKMLDGGASFEEVVTRYSTCPSKENAGDLGWMPEDNLQSMMGQEISKADLGKIVGPIHSKYGYHILKISEIEVEKKELVEKNISVMTCEELQQRIAADNRPVLLDIRENWERDISKIEGSHIISSENNEHIMRTFEKDREIVLIDWKQDRSPSFQKWLQQKGFTNVSCLEGGIDMWSEKIDTRQNRYDIDEDDGYRYEDIIEEQDGHEGHDHP